MKLYPCLIFQSESVLKTDYLHSTSLTWLILMRISTFCAWKSKPQFPFKQLHTVSDTHTQTQTHRIWWQSSSVHTCSCFPAQFEQTTDSTWNRNISPTVFKEAEKTWHASSLISFCFHLHSFVPGLLPVLLLLWSVSTLSLNIISSFYCAATQSYFT